MKLAEDERDVLVAEVAQAVEQARSPEMRVAYGELLTAVDLGEVPDDLQPRLEVLLEVGLESGRIRKLHLADGETAARRVYARTPRGEAIRASADQVNQALEALVGQSVEEVRIAPQGPGAYTLSLGTDQGRLLIRFDRQGVRLQSVEVG